MPVEFQVQKAVASLGLQTVLKESKSPLPRVRASPRLCLRQTLEQGTPAWYSGLVESYGWDWGKLPCKGGKTPKRTNLMT